MGGHFQQLVVELLFEMLLVDGRAFLGRLVGAVLGDPGVDYARRDLAHSFHLRY